MTTTAMKNSIQMDMVYHMDMWHECLAVGNHEEAEKHRKGYEEAKRELKELKGDN